MTGKKRSQSLGGRDKMMRLAAVLALTLCSALLLADTPEQILERYAELAKREDPAFAGFSVDSAAGAVRESQAVDRLRPRRSVSQAQLRDGFRAGLYDKRKRGCVVVDYFG